MRENLGTRIGRIADRLEDKAAVVCVGRNGQVREISWRALDVVSSRCAAHIRATATRGDEVVLVPSRNDLRGILSVISALRSGRLTAVMNPAMPAEQQEAVTRAITTSVGPTLWWDKSPMDVDALADEDKLGPFDESSGGILHLTGGSTGSSRLVVKRGVPSYDQALGAPLHLRYSGWSDEQPQMLLGPLYHTAPLSHLVDAILSGNTIVVPAETNPHQIFDLISRHSVEWIQLTPSHMQILAPSLEQNRESLRSIVGILHTAAPCAPAVKQAWIDAIGAEKVFEMYAATEGLGATICRGDEWMRKPGTVGRGFMTSIRILAEDGHPLPPGEIGMVYMKSGTRRPEVLGLRESLRSDGYVTVGDHGYLDESGYLYIKGRPDDLIIVGGENVYAHAIAVELMKHPSVVDAAVIGEDDDILGSRPVAIVVTRPKSGVTIGQLAEFALHTLTPCEVPHRFVLVDELPRTKAGKLPYSRLHAIVSTAE